MSIRVSITPVKVNGRTETLRVIGKQAGIQRIDTFDDEDTLIITMMDQSFSETIAMMQGKKSMLMIIFPKIYDKVTP